MRCAVIILSYERVFVVVQVKIWVGCVRVGALPRPMVITGKARVGRESNGRRFVEGEYEVDAVGAVHIKGAIPGAVIFDAFHG